MVGRSEDRTAGWLDDRTAGRLDSQMTGRLNDRMTRYDQKMIGGNTEARKHKDHEEHKKLRKQPLAFGCFPR